MRVAVLESPRNFRFVEQEPLPPGPEEVLIRLEGSGICASDLPVWEGRPWFDYPLPPGRPGHEGWGRVEAVGAQVTNVSPGDRVAALSIRAYADFDLAPAAEVVRLPEALAGKPFPGEPLACALNAFRRCHIQPGKSVAIIGAGFQGLLLTQLAMESGAKVVVISRRGTGLSAAEAAGAGATIVLDDHGKVLKEACALAGGEGFDCVVECTGHQWPLDLAAELTKVRGRLVIVGYHQEPRQVNMQLWNWRGIDVINAHERDPRLYVQGLREAVDAVGEGRINPWPLFTHSFELHELETALATVQERPRGFLKALVSTQ